jgi:hypothetical protein
MVMESMGRVRIGVMVSQNGRAWERAARAPLRRPK